MKARMFIGLSALAAGLAVTWAHAGEPVALPKAEVQKLLAGKTVVVEYVDPLHLEFSEKGSFKALATASAIRGIGTWSVDDRGRLCLKSPSPLLQGCRAVLRGDRGLGMTKADGTGFFAIGDIH